LSGGDNGPHCQFITDDLTVDAILCTNLVGKVGVEINFLLNAEETEEMEHRQSGWFPSHFGN
jgi:hypothetical protein